MRTSGPGTTQVRRRREIVERDRAWLLEGHRDYEILSGHSGEMMVTS